MNTHRIIAPLVALLASVAACDRPTDPDSAQTLGAAATADSSATVESSGDCQSLDVISMTDCRRIASLIAQCPGWDAHGKMDDAEWQAIIDLAYALQQLDPASIERVLTVYRAQLPALRRYDGADVETAPDPWTNPVLLIRVMIDTPEDAMAREQRALLMDAGIVLGSLFGTMAPSGQRSAFEESAAFPVMWRDGRPKLGAGRPIGVVLAGGSPHEGYDPAREYRALHRWYGDRKLDHLAPRISADNDAWHVLYQAMSAGEQEDG